MRTTLDLDPELIEEARRISNGKSKKAVIEEALREFINAKRRRDLLELIGSGALDMTLDDLWKMRGCDKARAETERLARRRRRP